MPELMAILLLAAAAGEGPQARHGRGRPATAEEIRARDITVLPSGAGLPKGKGTAREGRPAYEARCGVYHGARGEGQGDHPPLAGGRGSLATDQAQPTVGAYWPYATTVWDYIRRGMPYDHPATLSTDQVYAITAYVLYLDGIVTEDQVLDERTLPQVEMPNRQGFVADPRPPEKPVRTRSRSGAENR
jgi:S-disulfanyl-L-cysteine oxidoreductase SoxD